MKNWGTTLLRVVLGTVFLAHGLQKLLVYGLAGVAGSFTQLGIPFPELNAAVVIGVETLGGALLILGLFTRWVSAPLAFTMVVAALTAHRGSFFLPTGFEFVLVLFAGLVSLGLSGAGAFALDNLLAARRASLRVSPMAKAYARS